MVGLRLDLDPSLYLPRESYYFADFVC